MPMTTAVVVQNVLQMAGIAERYIFILFDISLEFSMTAPKFLAAKSFLMEPGSDGCGPGLVAG
jgi:hypothetical protein